MRDMVGASVLFTGAGRDAVSSKARFGHPRARVGVDTGDQTTLAGRSPGRRCVSSVTTVRRTLTWGSNDTNMWTRNEPCRDGWLPQIQRVNQMRSSHSRWVSSWSV
jgi:hypothetical protein